MSGKDAFRHVLVAAHRGNSRYYPENTLPAFQSALDLQVDNLEFDLHMTRDRELVLMHDHAVDRTTDGQGAVRDLTFQQVRALDAGAWKGEAFRGTRVPLFTELLDLIKQDSWVTLNVELKDYPQHDVAWAHEAADRALALLEEHGIAERCTINSWSGALLEYIHEAYEGRYKLHGYYPLELMGSGMKRDPYDILHCICLFGSKEQPVCDQAQFQYAMERGVEPWAYFADDNPAHILQAAQRGALLITSNDPEMTMGLLQSAGYRRL